jgi:hypothetical protein
LLALALLASDAAAYAPPPPHDYFPGFELSGHMPDAGKGGAGSSGARVVALGDDALAIDADSGQLLLANVTGHLVASLDIGANAGLLVLDPASRRVFVADRAHDRIAVVAAQHGKLELVATIATPPEPYGVALAGDSLLVTTIADHLVLAYDPAAGTERWRETVAAEPRAVAVAPDAKHAVVTHLTAGDVEMIDLPSHHVQARALRRDLEPRCGHFQNDEKSSLQCADPDGTSYARGAYTALFLGNSLAVVPFERETPVPRPQFELAQHYGGRAIPITRHVAFVGTGSAQAVAQISAAEPRALAYDAAQDRLYIAGMGDDHLVLVEHATQRDAYLGDWIPLKDGDRCGIDSLALAPDGDVLAWCSFKRSISRVHLALDANPKAIPRYAITFATGPELARSRLDTEAHAGMVRFHSASAEISEFGRAACASCHLEGRSDGLSWQIEGHALRTPVLAGRVAGTAPYKWSGRDTDLDHGIMATIDRLGGRDGKFRKDHDMKGPDPIAAYLTALAPPRAPTLAHDAITRGKALFDDLGCSGCHQGAAYTDQARHAFTGAPFEIDTPSLRGAAAAPRYLHDGSAATLDDVLADKGSIRGMIPRPLAESERADLAAFIRSL